MPPLRALAVVRPGQAEVVDLPEAPPPPGGFRVETLYSGISAGTEVTFVKGTNPMLTSSWDDQLGVFVPGRPATGYPVTTLGYMEVARIVDSSSPAVGSGDLVGMAYGHRSGHVGVPGRDRFVRLPTDLDPLLGIYAAHMGPICANGLLHAAAELSGPAASGLGDGVRGRNVLVTGAGVVGLLTGLFALHHGAAGVAVADTATERLAAAEALGLTPIDERETEAWVVAKEAWVNGPRDRGADVVFQCRGRPTALAGALRALRPQGTVIDLAFYQGGAGDLRLGEEFHHNGLTIRCAQIGRVPRGMAPAWTRDRLSAETLSLLQARGDAVRDHLVTDVVRFEEGPALLHDLAARRRRPIQAVLAFAS